MAMTEDEEEILNKWSELNIELIIGETRQWLKMVIILPIFQI